MAQLDAYGSEARLAYPVASEWCEEFFTTH
jgi:hypothetical protein